MNKNTSIVVKSAGEGFSIHISSEAEAAKAVALAIAAPLTQVTTENEQTAVLDAARGLKKLLSDAEKTRKAVKQPFFDAGKAIDAKANEYAAEMEVAVKRLEGLAGGYQLKLQQQRQAEEAERMRVQREAEAAAQRERERIAELERQSAQAVSDSERARIAAEAEAAQFDAMMAAEEAQEAAAVVVQPEIPKAQGAATSFVTEFEVTNVEHLYAWDLDRRRTLAEKLDKPLANFPSIFKMELKKADFKHVTQNLSEQELSEIPGVKFTKKAKVAVRL